MNSTQLGLVLNLLDLSISPQYHVVFYDMLSTVVSGTAVYLEVCSRLITSSNSNIQIRLDQEDYPELYYDQLTAD